MLFITELFIWKSLVLHYVMVQSENDQDLVFKNINTNLKDTTVLLSEAPKCLGKSDKCFRSFLPV